MPTPAAKSTIATTPASTTVSTTVLRTVPTTDIIELAPFAIHLPAQWSILRSSDDAWIDQLHDLQRTHPHLEHYIQKLLPASLAETSVIVAWAPSPLADTLVVAAITPADGLSLQGYLDAMTEELAQSRLIVGSAVTVHEAQLRYDLHQDNIPLALIQYTRSAKTKEQKIAGYQAAMLDSTTDRLLLLTIITPDPVAQASQVMIESLFRTITVE